MEIRQQAAVSRTLSLMLTVALACRLNAQTPPAFEVAAIRQSGPDEHATCGEYLPEGRLNIALCRLIYIVAQAYDLHYYQVVEAPGWAAEGDSSRFTIEAKAEGAATKDEMKLMLRELLASRFQLRFHRERREFQVLALTVDGDRSKLQVAKDAGKPRGSGGIEWVDAGWFRGRNVFIPFFADALSGQLGLPVLDRTKISDAVDFNLQWTPDEKADDAHPSMPTALREQLGLRLEAVKAPIEFLVVDHIEHPTAN